jgi:citrate lyase subunit beta/citryl-CoA lyase
MTGPAWLFCPADRPERFAKAAAAADIVILDLEDGVRPADKAAARRAIIDAPLAPERTVIRVNSDETDACVEDVRALESTEYRRIMLPKCESAAQIASFGGFEVIALIETPLGALSLREIAAADAVVGLMWGAEDLAASLGAAGSRRAYGRLSGVSRLVRAQTLLAAKAYGRLAIDSVYTNIPDIEGLAAEAGAAAADGFDAKASIHPSQMPVIRDAYLPSGAEIEWATGVLAASEGQRGAFAYEGKMIDAPVLSHAKRLLERARLAG